MLNNNAVKIRREIFIRLARLFFEGRFETHIDRIPLEMRPKHAASSRCCIYKDRVMLKYRCMAALGIGAEEERDELTSLREYAQIAQQRETAPPVPLTILSEACSACVQTRYQVTEACQGCLSRLCMMNCPKNAIEFEQGKARINMAKCVNCGKCLQVCPYKAIIQIPIPCEEICPTGAISKNGTGKETIDFDKCIFCGKCVAACPFGAIAERSQFLPILNALTGSRHATALLAPAAAGHFPGTLEQVHTALLSVGFDAVYDVGAGADITARDETAEFQERMAAQQPFMTSSCCPAYVEAVRKLVPELSEYVSHTVSPMITAAAIAKERHPETVTVFIGPCIAKRMEGALAKDVDYVMTFEELGAIFVAKEIEVGSCEPTRWENASSPIGRGFPVSGGVANAIRASVDSPTCQPFVVNGLDRRQIKYLKHQLRKQPPGNFIEVMACEGGCAAGPAGLSDARKAAKRIEEWSHSTH